jgi:hypothetical protein
VDDGDDPFLELDDVEKILNQVEIPNEFLIP